MNRKQLLVLTGMIWSATAAAQQRPYYTQYIMNNYLINPAVGGSMESIDIKVGYRTQWMGFDAAPRTMFVSIHSPIKPAKGKGKRFKSPNHDAIGGYVINDQTGQIFNIGAGPISKLGAYISYAYHVRLNRKLMMSMGFFAGIIQYSINSDVMITATPNDPAVFSVSSITPDASAGLWLYSNDFFTGISAQQLLPINIAPTNNKLNTHLFLTTGYRIKTGRGSIIPSAHVKIAMLTPVSVDLNLKWDWMNKFWIGVSYRKIDAVAGLVGFNIKNRIAVGYAYDYTLSKLRNASSNTHEIIIGIKPKKTYKPFCPAYM